MDIPATQAGIQASTGMQTDLTGMQTDLVDEPVRRGQSKLLLLLIIGFAPVLAAWLLIASDWRPTSTIAEGQLLTPAMPLSGWWTDNSYPAAGFWTVVEVVPADCHASCLVQLQQLTGMHLALGKEAGRVRRLWLGAGDLNLSAYQQDPYLFIRGNAPMTVSDGMQRFIVDPAGHQILTYSPEQPIKAIMTDLKRLLRASSAG